jgi:hypothetical protein
VCEACMNATAVGTAVGKSFGEFVCV